MLTPFTLTPKILATLASCFPYGDDLELEYSQTFAGCGDLQMLFQKNGNPRTFSELRYTLTLFKLCSMINTQQTYCCNNAQLDTYS